MHGRRSRRAVVTIAADRHLTTTAEGVETEQQRELLRELGCSEMQGYLFSPPKPAAEIRPMLLADRHEPEVVRPSRVRRRKPVVRTA
jgi:EAL domain-containing protein (putative c-di-GMP-specific phosphodiesterase class I)